MLPTCEYELLFPGQFLRKQQSRPNQLSGHSLQFFRRHFCQQIRVDNTEQFIRLMLALLARLPIVKLFAERVFQIPEVSSCHLVDHPAQLFAKHWIVDGVA